MLVLSCLIGTYLSVTLAEKEGIPAQKSLNAALFAILSAIFGAWFYYLAQHYRFFVSHPLEMFAMWKGGFASYGGFIGGTLGAALYLRRARIAFWKFADCCAPSIALGVFLTRIGCFMNGCCFGKISQLPWAVRFPRGSPAYVLQLVNGQISAREALSLSVHPTQIYHALHGLILFLILIRLRKYKTADGQVFWGFALFYSIGRFMIEFYRGDVVRGFVGVLSLPQFFSVILIVISCYFLYRSPRQRKSLFGSSQGYQLQERERSVR